MTYSHSRLMTPKQRELRRKAIRSQKRIQRGFAALWAFFILLGVAFWATVFTVAFHFIGKYW